MTAAGRCACGGLDHHHEECPFAPPSPAAAQALKALGINLEGPHRSTVAAPELDATAALTRLCGLLPHVLTLHGGACFMADSRSFERLPGRPGTWRKVALLDAGRFHWYVNPLLLVDAVWTALRHQGADHSFASEGQIFRAGFWPIGNAHDLVMATADSEVLAVARAAVAYLEMTA